METPLIRAPGAGATRCRNGSMRAREMRQRAVSIEKRQQVDLGRQHAAPCAGMDQQQGHGGADQERGCDPERKLVLARTGTDIRLAEIGVGQRHYRAPDYASRPIDPASCVSAKREGSIRMVHSWPAMH